MKFEEWQMQPVTPQVPLAPQVIPSNSQFIPGFETNVSETVEKPSTLPPIKNSAGICSSATSVALHRVSFAEEQDCIGADSVLICPSPFKS